MPLINCRSNLILTWSANCIICKADGATTFAITDTKVYVSAMTLSTKDNTKLEQLKWRFKCTINWNKYQSKLSNFQGPSRQLHVQS